MNEIMSTPSLRDTFNSNMRRGIVTLCFEAVCEFLEIQWRHFQDSCSGEPAEQSMHCYH